MWTNKMYMFGNDSEALPIFLASVIKIYQLNDLKNFNTNDWLIEFRELGRTKSTCLFDSFSHLN